MSFQKEDWRIKSSASSSYHRLINGLLRPGDDWVNSYGQVIVNRWKAAVTGSRSYEAMAMAGEPL